MFFRDQKMNMEMPDGDQGLGRWPRAKEITQEGGIVLIRTLLGPLQLMDDWSITNLPFLYLPSSC